MSKVSKSSAEGTALDDKSDEQFPMGSHLIGRIPVRNIWLLMLYASELSTISEHFYALLERDIDKLPDLVGGLLASEVERRIARNLSLGYRHRSANLPRVRGRIDLLVTVSAQLLERGLVACRFEEITIDTVRNRLVRSALERIARYPVDPALTRRCRGLARDMEIAGVGRARPTRSELAKEQVGRNDSADLVMISLAKLAFDLALPTEEAGATPILAPNRDEHWVRRLFEKAIGGFCRAELTSLAWRVRCGVKLSWPVVKASVGAGAIMPGMQTDIILDSPEGKRTVVDTKFTSITTSGWFRDQSLKTGYIYQIYSYLRSQEDVGDPSNAWNKATGILLHPSIGKDLDESVLIQGHQIRFATVDLSGTAAQIRGTLQRLFLSPSE